MSVRFWDVGSLGDGRSFSDARATSLGLEAALAGAPGAPETARAGARDTRPRPLADRRLMVETFGVEAAETHVAAWRDLVDRALEPNAFMDPSFAAPAALHVPPALRPEFVAVWEGIGFEPRGRMIGLMAIRSRSSFLTRGLAIGWLHPHAAVGAPLVDRMAATRAIDALFDWIARERRGWTGLVLPRLVRTGPLFSALIARAVANNRAWSVAAPYERAVLLSGQSSDNVLRGVHSPRLRKEHNRKLNRLRDLGRIEIRSTSGAGEVRDSIETFLALEQKGWKGRRGTALLSSVGDATFTRVMTRLMARRGQCRIDCLTLNDRPVAMAIMIASAGRCYFWKTAYDESFAAYSPGALLARMLIERQLAEPGIDLTDSCAIADHPMIDRIWPDRQTMADFEICCAPPRARAFDAAIRRRTAWRKLRASAKLALAGALGRRIS